MSVTSPTVVSIVVPTYNEQEDITRTVESLLALKYPHKEIIIVDDSTDATPTILDRYRARGVQTYREKHAGGRCGARNLGIRMARGDVVVILNADVCPEPDFLDRVLAHYRTGAEYLVVGNRVANIEYLFPRYVDAVHNRSVDLDRYLWTEGFSCTREAALAVGLFPVDTPLPYCGGEDVIFGQKLRERFRRATDGSIVVAHYFPARFREFWANRWQRGWGSPVFKYFCLRQGLLWIVIVAVGKTAINALRIGLGLPASIRAYRTASYSSRGLVDCVPFLIADGIETVAMAIGEWAGIIDVFRHRKWSELRTDKWLRDGKR